MSLKGRRPKYAVWLEDRGSNVNLVKNIERGAGGNPRTPTPYEVVRYSLRVSADDLVRRFRQAGAQARVETVGGAS